MEPPILFLRLCGFRVIWAFCNSAPSSETQAQKEVETQHQNIPLLHTGFSAALSLLSSFPAHIHYRCSVMRTLKWWKLYSQEKAISGYCQDQNYSLRKGIIKVITKVCQIKASTEKRPSVGMKTRIRARFQSGYLHIICSAAMGVQ